MLENILFTKQFVVFYKKHKHTHMYMYVFASCMNFLHEYVRSKNKLDTLTGLVALCGKNTFVSVCVCVCVVTG